MAIQDYLMTLSYQQEETTVAAHDSEIFDYGAAVEWSQGTPLYLNVVIGTAFTSGGAATLAVALQDSADGSTFAAVTPTGLSVAAQVLATLTAGRVLMRVAIPYGVRRYIKLVYTIGTAVMTAGSIDAWLELE